MLGGGLGKLAGIAAVGLTGLTGGLAAPLIMGVANSLMKKWVDEGTQKGVFGKDLKGADVSKIKGDEFGYGKEEAKAIREQLKEGRQSEFGADSMLGDIAQSYLTAGVSGQLGGAKALLKGRANWGEALKGTGPGGMEGLKQAFGAAIPGEGGAEDSITNKLTMDQPAEIASNSSNIIDTPIGETFIDESGNPVSYFKKGGLIYAMGGQVPTTYEGTALESEEDKLVKTNEGLALLLSLSQTNPNQGRQEERDMPTISEYFGNQGKSLGGNNQKSIGQMLGR